MKGFFKKVLLVADKIKSMILRFIDWLAKQDIEKANREYELKYDKQLSEQEMIDIKKNVIIRLWKYAAFVIIILIVLLSQL